ncbi:unnamed protein product [Blepharisma stoltei]|uniref:RING-type domain-containing protein n=1 Tax=Blepharisma stoltei TaxID=1481888 RepID=A0AAU9IIE5_9CILI|nr:unnamed protein product [Blepharisma stoltei]
MRPSKYKEPSSSAINAAALQDHLLRSLGFNNVELQPSTVKPKSNPLASFGRKIVNDRKNHLKSKPHDSDIEEIRQRAQNFQNKLTLAQRLGLIEKPAAPLNEDQWLRVEQKAQSRGEHKGCCPICQEVFGRASSVILSCTHVFHKQCLQSFEKYAKIKVCPICRRNSYEKKNYHKTEEFYREQCAIKIQAYYRGYRARKAYMEHLRLNPPQHPLVRRKYFGQQLHGLTDKLTEDMDRRERSIEFLFRQLDEQQEASRQVFQAFQRQQARTGSQAQQNRENSEEWEHIKHQALIRNDKECAICLQSFHDRREKCVLSCSHVFHSKCIEGFEYFDIHKEHHCPVCRQQYSRTTFH